MKSIKVNKSDYEVHQFTGKYYGIIEKGSFGGACVYGGDSADEDHYNKELIDEVFENWDGTLTDCGNDKYGDNGFVIELP